jgi:hypothetical protein
VDKQQSTAHPAQPPTEEQDHPYACLNGYIDGGVADVDEETGEELERVEALPYRRCADSQ